jgi:hypothetical protein
MPESGSYQNDENYFAIENVKSIEPKYNGHMKNFSTTYHPGTGTLQLYGHHTTPPQVPGGQTVYHMSQLRSFAMTDNAERFREGAKAFRNLRDLAKEHRDEFVAQANQTSRHAPPESPSTTFTDSDTSLSILHESEPDTSADELAIEETTIKHYETHASSSVEA